MSELYYGDNLTVLRESIRDESVDLIYLDPPFNSNANYNILFKAPTGENSRAQIEAFEDTWHWNDSAESAFDDVMRSDHSDAATMLRAMRSALGENDMMAYLAMMTVRLIEMHQKLKQTGSLYLHCDPSASHYLKILLDAIFGASAFRNEVIWRRHGSHNDVKHGYAAVHDTILFYAKSSSASFNRQFDLHDPAYIENSYRQVDPDGRRWRVQNLASPSPRPNLTYAYTALNGITYAPHPNGWKYTKDRMIELDRAGLLYYPSKPTGRLSLKSYLDGMKGVPLPDVWTNIQSLNGSHTERLGYPTQKPIALLERIIQASSREGQIILDPFCGCGTAVHAAQRTGRGWIGIDVTHLAIALVERRLKEAFEGIQFDVHGVPKDVGGARNLAERDKYEFQKWITAKIGGQPYKGGKKGMDRGVDGFLHFRDALKKPQFAIISVKGGSTNPGDVRDLKGTMERENAALGIFLTLNDPTREMEKEATTAKFYETGGRRFPRLQILTAAQILDGRLPQIPFGFTEGFARAERESMGGQQRLF